MQCYTCSVIHTVLYMQCYTYSVIHTVLYMQCYSVIHSVLYIQCYTYSVIHTVLYTLYNVLYVAGGAGGGSVEEEDTVMSLHRNLWGSDQQTVLQPGPRTPSGLIRHAEGGVTFSKEGMATHLSLGLGEHPATVAREGRVGVAMETSTGTRLERSVDGVPSGNGSSSLLGVDGRRASGLRLCSEGFDGLFETNLTPTRSPLNKKLSHNSSSRRKGKERARESSCLPANLDSVSETVECGVASKEREREGSVEGRGRRREGGEGERGEEDDWVPTREEVEALEREMMEEGEEWEEGQGEEGQGVEEEEVSSQCSTDEELGPGKLLRSEGVSK